MKWRLALDGGSKSLWNGQFAVAWRLAAASKQPADRPDKSGEGPGLRTCLSPVITPWH